MDNPSIKTKQINMLRRKTLDSSDFSGMKII